MTLATKAYREYTDSKGANATVTKNLETAMERERLAVARLEAQLKSLSTQKISLDTTQIQENISRPNSNIQNVKIKAEIDTSKLQGATAAFDAQKIHISDVTKELELQRQKLIQLRESMYRSAIFLQRRDSLSALHRYRQRNRRLFCRSGFSRPRRP